jgi:hypothetical protein
MVPRKAKEASKRRRTRKKEKEKKRRKRRTSYVQPDMGGSIIPLACHRLSHQLQGCLFLLQLQTFFFELLSRLFSGLLHRILLAANNDLQLLQQHFGFVH